LCRLRLWLRGATGKTIFLHISTTTFPFGNRRTGVQHILFLDSTVHLESLYTICKLNDAQTKKNEAGEQRVVAAADHVFTTSERVRQDIVEYYSIPPERVTAVGTGMGNVRCIEGEKPYSSCTTLFVAKDRFEEKGGLLLLEGFRLAQASDPRLKLIVVAPEPYREVAESVPGVAFKTALPWNELETLFNEASLFAMPALYEPWGLVYVEALACRTPVLGMNRNALPELTQNGEYGFLLDEATPSCVAAKLLNAYSDIDRLAAMGYRGQQYVRSRYSWDLTAARITDALVASDSAEESSSSTSGSIRTEV
jgi:glycosyltransferase involved in cell wall biosynthesis